MYLYDSPLSISHASSRASVTDLEVPTPYAGSLDVARATSPAPTNLRFEVQGDCRKNILGLDLNIPPVDRLSTLETDRRLGSHDSSSPRWSGEYFGYA